ncbi:energy transducer TonB [Vibrio methylphosphonaticus]|uniref:energy transducer TonB n=1 Tax=Vibrio methylphosphonaticus TaxID=2946866 RepID=UPI00202A66C6|nr:energy transducer TonB [Vibrio methylphosphonaticus]MCL9773871.1 energy transducer TonB [Vibrio methylphosphonaticus]
MNVKRYVVAGSLSVAFHIGFMLVDDTQQVFAMPSGSHSTSVSLNFIAQSSAASPAPAPTPASDTDVPTDTPEKAPVPPNSAETNSAETHSTHRKPVESRPVQKSVTKADSSSVTKNKKQPVKQEDVVHKAPKKTSATPKKSPKEQTKPAPKKSELKEENKETKTSENDSAPTSAQPAIVNQGVSNEPVLRKTPSFTTTPVQPRYPRVARKRGIEGTATYEIWLDESGNQTKQVLVSSSGATILDKTALDAIKQWQFSAYTVKGVAVAHRIQIPVRFKLD